MQMKTDERFRAKKPKLQKPEVDKNLALQKKNEKRNQTKKLKQLMKKRLIIRNLSFQVSEEKLKEVFSKFGEVLEVNIPLNSDGKKRGFAFIRYKDTKSQVQAMKAMNFKKIAGRPIAIDYAVDKITYQTQLQNTNSKSKSTNKCSKDESFSESEDSKMENENSKMKEPDFNDSSEDDEDDDDEDDDKRVKTFLKEFDADADEQSAESSDESSEEEQEDDDDNESHYSQDTIHDNSHKRKESNDVSEGKTVFIRNISFKNTEEDLQEVAQDYGETEYCLLCVDPLTDFPKGTAFIKFKEKDCADKLIENSLKEPGILLDGRKLLCTYAISRGEISKMKDQSPKVKDKRNLRLLKCGLIMQGSEEAEGVSQTDMAKRTQLEMMKKQKLKNVNFFVSDVRLAVHNIPINVTDKELRELFKKTAGKDAVVNEARVMRDFKKTNAQGFPLSKGFGFVSFTRHEDALKALTEINNNPSIFTAHKRPIVEFSVESKVALLAQQRKKEKIQLKNKKRMEEKLAEKSVAEQKVEKQPVQKANFGDKKRKNKMFLPKKRKQSAEREQLHVTTQTTKAKKKQKKHHKKGDKRKLPNKQENQSLFEKANKYKNKLLKQM